MAAMMKEMSSLGIRDRFKAMQELQQGGMFNPGSQMAKPKGGTGKRLTPDERSKLRKQREKDARKKKRENKRGKARPGPSGSLPEAGK